MAKKESKKVVYDKKGKAVGYLSDVRLPNKISGRGCVCIIIIAIVLIIIGNLNKNGKENNKSKNDSVKVESKH